MRVMIISCKIGACSSRLAHLRSYVIVFSLRFASIEGLAISETIYIRANWELGDYFLCFWVPYAVSRLGCPNAYKYDRVK